MILVTGGTGLLGSFVVRELQQRELPVRILSRPQSEQAARATGAEVAVGDLSNPLSLRRAAQGVTGIIHAASTFTDSAVDVAAMKVLLDSWQQGPFVFISSVSVYGYSQWLPTAEDHPLDDTSDYASGKIRSEALLQEEAHRQARSDWSVLRPPHIWGPDLRSLQNPASPVTALYMRIAAGEPVILPGSTASEWTRFGDDWVDARELAWVAAECLTHPAGTALNVINSHFTWHDFCAVLIESLRSASTLEHKALSQITPTELGSKEFFAQTWRYSTARLEQHLAFRARYHWQDTIVEAIQAQ